MSVSRSYQQILRQEINAAMLRADFVETSCSPEERLTLDDRPNDMKSDHKILFGNTDCFPSVESYKLSQDIRQTHEKYHFNLVR